MTMIITGGRAHLARRLSTYFSPPVMPVVAGCAVGWRTTWPSYDGLLWGLYGCGSWVLLCTAVAFAGTRLGWWPTHVPSERGPRLMLLAATLLAAAAVWMTCRRLGAPAPLLAVGTTAPLLAALLLVSTWVTNVSLHTGAAAAGVTLLTLELGPAWVLLYPLVAAIGWSRLRLRAHSLGQVLAGAALGTTACVAVVCLGR
ncbi:phosphatase PAP2 family protein [Streptomyces sp. BK79]|uniref:phosphatase PAP2 family protein n=1 Tax=Streptomyces sp. BK79 TaxID=3350097 RepID=UPI00376F7DE5